MGQLGQIGQLDSCVVEHVMMESKVVILRQVSTGKRFRLDVSDATCDLTDGQLTFSWPDGRTFSLSGKFHTLEIGIDVERVK